MICFPLNNTDYEADALGAWFGTRTRGVFSADNHFSVSANGDMTVTVGGGLAWLLMGDYWGTVVLETDPQTLTIDTADGSLARVDAICLQLDKNANLAKITIKKGTYSPQPAVITAPARNQDYDEIYVASVTVRAGATSILPTDITDLRLDETYCGVMRDGVSGIPTQALQDMWTAWFSAWKTQTDQDFEAWFDTVKGLLGEDEAGALALAIEDVKGMITNPNLLINGGFKVFQELPGPYVAKAGASNTLYTVDQWGIYGAGTMARRDGGGVDITGATDFYLVQPLEISRFDRSKPHTISIEASTAATSGTNKLVVGIGLKKSLNGAYIHSGNISSKTLTAIRTKYTFTADFLGDYEADYVVVYIVVQGTATIYNAKLEQGNVATPYVPEDEAVELLRCMRYYWRPKTEILSHTMSTDSIWVNVGLVFPVQMRVAPTTTYYEPGNIDYPDNPNNYKFGEENWGAPNHIWWVGDSDRSHYVSVQGASVRNDGLVLLQISSGTGNASSTYSFHAEFDARIR